MHVRFFGRLPPCQRRRGRPGHRIPDRFPGALRRDWNDGARPGVGWSQAVYDRRSALGWSSVELARRAGLAEEDIESIEESGVDPTLELIERLAVALDSGARIDPGSSPEFRFEERAS